MFKPGDIIRRKKDFDSYNWQQKKDNLFEVTSCDGERVLFNCIAGASKGCVGVAKDSISPIYSNYEMYSLDQFYKDYPQHKGTGVMERERTIYHSYIPKVGDRVECIAAYGVVSTGMKGKVVKILTGPGNIGVEWDTLTNGNDCHGACPNGKGYFVYDSYIKLCNNDSYGSVNDDSVRYISKRLVAQSMEKSPRFEQLLLIL